MDEMNILRKFMELKKAKEPIQTPSMVENKKKEETKKKNKEFIKEDANEESAINQIIEEKPKLKVVCRYLQDRIDELNAHDLED
jgi:hypothetical protein